MKVRTIPVLVSGTILFIAFGLAWAAAREPVSISGQVTLSGGPPFLGEATLAVAGEASSATVAVVPMQEPVPKDGGLYFPEVEHVFTRVDDGSTLTTTGEELAMPTDENPAIFTLHGNMATCDLHLLAGSTSSRAQSAMRVCTGARSGTASFTSRRERRDDERTEIMRRRITKVTCTRDTRNRGRPWVVRWREIDLDSGETASGCQSFARKKGSSEEWVGRIA